MRFLADGMLGRLARWLRILGHDTAYLTDADDNTLIGLAAAEDRILLTGDRDLYKKSLMQGVNAFLVEPADHMERLAGVAARFSLRLEIDTESPRCPRCNFPLRETPRQEVEGRIPSRSITMSKSFWRCAGCGKLYWQGSHWKDIQGRLAYAKKAMPRIDA